MLGTRTLRERSRERSRTREPDGSEQKARTPQVKEPKQAEKSSEKLSSGGFTEPPVLARASYKDSTASYYGVSDYMQPLGEAPSQKVKTRIKADGARKSMVGKDGTPQPKDGGTPQPPIQSQRDTPSLPQIKVEDENDGDYAPKGSAKKQRTRAAKRQSDAPAASRATAPAHSKPQTASKDINKNKKYDAVKLKSVVEAAKKRAIDVNKPDLADAVNEIYENSLTNTRLTELLEAILTQEATPAQTLEFQSYVRDAKREFYKTSCRILLILAQGD